MTDEKAHRPETDAARNGRVADALGDLHQALGDSLSQPARESLQKLRDAVAAGDRDKAREHLLEVREKHGWLYNQLANHPEIAAVVNELAIWGF